MKACHTTDPRQFLDKVQSALEQDEAANQAMLVRCRDLCAAAAQPGSASMVWTEDAQGVTAAALLAPPDPMWLFCEPQPKEASLQLLLNMLRDVPFKRVKGKSHVITSFSELLKQMYGCAVETVGREKVLKLTRNLVNPFVTGYMRLAVAADADQIIEWLEAVEIEKYKIIKHEISRKSILEEIAAGSFYLWEDGLMVSMLARVLPTRHGTALNRLYTPPPLRNRSYATGLVNALCAQLFQEGNAYCTVALEPKDEVANHIFQRLGFVNVCELDEIEVRS